MRVQFVGKGNPRLVMLVILTLSGLAAFAYSAGALRLGVDHMGWRYLGATLAGYAAFLMLIRVWIAFHRKSLSLDLDLPELPDGQSRGSGPQFSGGSSGGGGASADWGGSGELGTPDLDMDLVDADEAWPLVLAVAVVLGILLATLFALLYVVNVAPVLLAEVALDAALLTGVYRKLRRQDARYWLGSVIRRTWKPAVIVMAGVSLAGVVLQWAVPSARTFGDVFRVVNG